MDILETVDRQSFIDALKPPGARIREALRQGCACRDPGHAVRHDPNSATPVFRNDNAPRESQQKKQRRHEPVPAPVAHRHPPAHFRRLRADPGFPDRGGAACGDAALARSAARSAISSPAPTAMPAWHASMRRCSRPTPRSKNSSARATSVTATAPSRRSTSSARCSTQIEGQFGRLPAIAEGQGVLAASHDTYRKSFAAVSRRRRPLPQREHQERGARRLGQSRLSVATQRGARQPAGAAAPAAARRRHGRCGARRDAALCR